MPARPAVHALLAAAAAAHLLAGPVLAQAAPSGSARHDPVVGADWLRAHLRDPGLVVLAVDMPGMGRDDESYARGHIPGARALDFHAIEASGAAARGLTMEMPPADSVRRVLEALGVSDGARIVLYGPAGRTTQVARAYVTLDWLGLGDRTSVLDGGLAAWKAAGGAVDTAAPRVARGRLRAAPTRDVVVDGAWMRSHLGAATLTVLDARAPSFFSGAELGHQAARTGRIPGARNLFYRALLDSATSRYRSRDEARALLAGAGVPLDRPLVVYCHIGQTASVAYLQARRLGVPVKLYDGSFQGWSRETAWPVEGGGR